MSLSQFIKDYIEALNNFYDYYSGQITFLPFFNFNLSYLGEGFFYFVEYVISFRWLIDFCSLKIVIPEIINSNFIEEYSLEDPLFRFFSFFDSKDRSLSSQFYLIGLFNSFFYCLPFSSGNLILLRRVSIDGIYGGLAAVFGIVLAQLFIIISMVFGLRFLVFPWFAYEIIHYGAGVFLTIFLVGRVIRQSLVRAKPTDDLRLGKICLFHFGFTFTEQVTYFQYLSNVTVNPEPTIFEGADPGIFYSFMNQLDHNSQYYLGLFFGMSIWYIVFAASFFGFGYAFAVIFRFQYAYWVRSINRGSVILMIGIAVSSLAYYSAEFTATAPVGYIPYDEGATRFQTRTYTRDWRKGRLGELSSQSSYDTDPAPYDHGRYVTGREVELTFEDLNYQGEYAWRSRHDRFAVGSRGKINKWFRSVIPKFIKSKSKDSQVEVLPPKFEDLWKFFDIYSTISPFSDDEDLILRFVDDYQGDVARSEFPDKKIAKSEKSKEDLELQFSPFEEFARYAFDFFSANVDFETDDFEESLGRRLKQKYFSNYVYQNLLRADMSLFLTRQPRKHRLKVEEENTLFKKRQILASYYDSLRTYTKLPYLESYEDLFLGPKSYANRVYNQQFKGTLKVVKRLFSINLEPRHNPFQKSILKYDQPLYTYKKNDLPPPLHEELLHNLSELKNQEPFLKETNPIPFYAGWDEDSRKFLITNYLLAHADASIKTDFYKEPNGPVLMLPFFQQWKHKRNNTHETIYFITWPIPDSKLDRVQRSSKPPLNLLYNIFDDPGYALERDLFEFPVGEKTELVYKTLPSLTRRIDLRERDKVRIPLHPLSGGYVWSNNKPLQIKLKKRLIDYLPEELREKIIDKISNFKIRFRG